MKVEGLALAILERVIENLGESIMNVLWDDPADRYVRQLCDDAEKAAQVLVYFRGEEVT